MLLQREESFYSFVHSYAYFGKRSVALQTFKGIFVRQKASEGGEEGREEGGEERGEEAGEKGEEEGEEEGGSSVPGPANQ